MSSDIKMDLFGIPSDVLYSVILYPMRPVDLYRFSQVSNGCLKAIQEVAKMPQKNFFLIARVTVLKEGEEEGEKTEVIVSLPFTNIHNLKAEVEQIAQKNGIIFKDHGDNSQNVRLALEIEKDDLPPNKQNTISTLLRQRVKMEIVLRHLDLMKDEKKYSKLNADEIGPMKLSIILKHPWQISCAYLPLLVPFDFSAKNCSVEELAKTLISTSQHDFRVFPEVTANLVKACFSHPHAPNICAWSLTQALAISIGKNCQIGHYYYGIDIVGGFRGEDFITSTLVNNVSVIPPGEMLPVGETKDLTIPKLIFAQPNAKEMDLKYPITNIFLCAVRYRAADVLQIILNHPDAVHISDHTLGNGLDEANEGGEQESAKIIATFIKGRAAKKKEQGKDQKCVVS